MPEMKSAGQSGSSMESSKTMGVGGGDDSVKRPREASDAAVLTADTITKLPAEATGAVVVSGSHGGLYPGTLAAKARVRAVILNDAGIGKDEAGIASLHLLERFGIAAAAVSHMSCRIGDTADMIDRGVISHANAPARACGVTGGMSCREAAEALRKAPLAAPDVPTLVEGRSEVQVPAAHRRVILLDSAALVRPDDSGHIVVTASHGGLVGGNPAMALRTDAFAAVFHDAGIGVDGAGLTRLPALDERGIAAVTVAASSARIGEALSVFEEGVVSAANAAAQRLGAQIGRPVRSLLEAWARL
ncbi:hypothetical protein [Microvirga massiliensis]|uniref:hypothetical protein n=1 Tax=Microvirga massiliensis TaxID=1033741 RepID=UPI000A865B6B|nr:hypothetical protein [Microvirga massiliensis]